MGLRLMARLLRRHTVAEATLTAPEETQVPQTEEPSSPPAPEEPVTPTSEGEQPDAEPNLDSVHEEFLSRLGATEDAPTESEPGKLSPEAQAEVDRQREEDRKEAERLSRENGIYSSFRDNATTLRTWAAQVNLPAAETEKLVNFFRDYHGTSGQIHRAEATAAEVQRQVTAWAEGGAKALKLSPAKSQELVSALMKPEMNQLKAAELLVSRAREGYVSQAEAKKIKTDAVNEYKAFLIEKKLLKGHDAPPEQGSAAGAGRSDDDLLADPNTPITVVMAIRERQRAAGG